MGLYQRFFVQLFPHHTRISSSLLIISHHDRHHGALIRAEPFVVWTVSRSSAEMDLLNMFRILRYSVEQVASQLSDDEVRMLTFRGLDLNDDFESRLLGYARWLIVTSGKLSKSTARF